MELSIQRLEALVSADDQIHTRKMLGDVLKNDTVRFAFSNSSYANAVLFRFAFQSYNSNC